MLKTNIHLLYYQFKLWNKRKNVWVFWIFLILLADMYLRPTRRLIDLLGVAPDTTVFPLIWNNTFFLMLFYFSVILYFSDVPFRDSLSRFLLIRCGRFRYVCSHLFYILCSGIVISGFFFLIQWAMLPAPVFGSWGKFWGTIVQTPIAYETGSGIEFQYHILWDFTPQEALAITFSISVLLNVLSGLFLYFCSLLGQRTVGMCIAAVFAVLPHIVSWLDFTTFYWLSPYSWLCLDTTMRHYNGSLPSLSYAFPVLILLNIILTAAILIEVLLKKDMEEHIS